jgi:hypothetical protein
MYCQLPVGFINAERRDHVCLLDKLLYGFKQAPRAWYDRFAQFLLSIGFVASKSNTSLFIL